jgi:hypothetical protein
LLTDCFVKFCTENALNVNIKKTKAMYVNCSAKLKIGKKLVKSVKEFKYLGLKLTNNSKRPEALL